MDIRISTERGVEFAVSQTSDANAEILGPVAFIVRVGDVAVHTYLTVTEVLDIVASFDRVVGSLDEARVAS